MSKRRENETIDSIDEHLENVAAGGEFTSNLDITPLSRFIEKYYSTKEANNRKEFFDDVLASAKDKNIRESIGTRSLEGLEADERKIIEEIISHVIDYSSGSIALGIATLLKSATVASNIFNLRDQDDEDFIKFRDLNNIISKDNLAQIVSTLDGIEYIKNIETDIEEEIIPDVISIMQSGDLDRDQENSLCQLIALAEFGCIAGRIIEKLSSAATKLAPDAKKDMEDIEDGIDKSTLDKENKEKEDRIADTLDRLRDVADNFADEALHDVDVRDIEKLLGNLSASDFKIVENLIDGKYPLSIDQSAANGLNRAIELVMSLDEDEPSIETLDTQIAFAYVIVQNNHPDDNLDDLFDEYCDYLDLDEDDSDLIDRKISDVSVAEFALDNEMGEALLYRIVSTGEFGSQYEAIIRDTMCGRDPIISMEEIEDYVDRYSRDGDECREKDITNMISENRKAKTEYETEVRSWFGDLIAKAYNNLKD